VSVSNVTPVAGVAPAPTGRKGSVLGEMQRGQPGHECNATPGWLGKGSGAVVGKGSGETACGVEEQRGDRCSAPGAGDVSDAAAGLAGEAARAASGLAAVSQSALIAVCRRSAGASSGTPAETLLQPCWLREA
jgi:hypothetical protein